ncbi:PREDICTED: putative B3 domain-containing protein REM4 isoform X1 [Nicotiana attenuata]|uniref:putative B3 domain-containing protein REM4 isoform X1 n=1 Tax=Nicotiana attenuata TaxID=49451 RepID=UPI0009054873|nr:PREDICTED: putative B3 domain-containing protein REM4 isoform X1 [Nicotiana attenuata]XP_019254325.1 PREDICTED: putative B3 domain-containing protein REM4 isoform X1 [Nicotiana attenuata]
MICNWEIYWCSDMKGTWSLRLPSLIRVTVTEYLLDEEEANNVEFKEAATHNPFGQSHFSCIVRASWLKGYLCIPTRFAAENGLTNKNCGLIIRDETQRSWNLRLYTSCSRVYIGGRWGEFRVANDLEVGDRIMFEIVTNGEKPIWKFHGKYSVEVAKREDH